MSQVLRQRTDLAQRFVLRRADHRCQQPVFDRHGDAEIDVGILRNRIAVERSVCSRNLHRGHHSRFQDEIVYCDIGGVSVFACGFQFLARFHQRSGIDVDGEIKMWNRAETFDQALRNDFTHPGKLNARAFASFNGGWD